MEENDAIYALLKNVVLKNEKMDRKEELWDSIRKETLTAGRKKTVIRRVWWIAAVAVVAIALVIGGFASQKNIVSGGDKMAVALPGGSASELGANSSLHYNSIGWAFARKVALEGTAIFEVTKGRKFTVHTSEGDITVLGTKFLVTEDRQGTALHIECYEGSVRIDTKAGSEVLKKGEKADCSNEGIIKAEILPEFITYDGVALKEIIEKIETVYDVNVSGKEKYDSMTFSGLLPTGNLKDALDIVFGSCGIDFELNGKDITLK
jgi:Fe2+-dicitrate sensor, membrane component